MGADGVKLTGILEVQPECDDAWFEYEQRSFKEIADITLSIGLDIFELQRVVGMNSHSVSCHYQPA